MIQLLLFLLGTSSVYSLDDFTSLSNLPSVQEFLGPTNWQIAQELPCGSKGAKQFGTFVYPVKNCKYLKL